MKDKKIRILYIDDRPFTVETIVKTLEEDFDVVLETDAEKARRRLLREPYDVIILDWEMVQQDYADRILEKIRKENYLIKVIMVTAKIRNIRELADVINWGISKCYFKEADELFDNLKEGIKEVVETRDSILQGLESWMNVRKGSKKKIIHLPGGKSYTAGELLDEIKKSSKVGKEQTKAIVSLVLDLLSEKKR